MLPAPLVFWSAWPPIADTPPALTNGAQTFPQHLAKGEFLRQKGRAGQRFPVEGPSAFRQENDAFVLAEGLTHGAHRSHRHHGVDQPRQKAVCRHCR